MKNEFSRSFAKYWFYRDRWNIYLSLINVIARLIQSNWTYIYIKVILIQPNQNQCNLSSISNTFQAIILLAYHYEYTNTHSCAQFTFCAHGIYFIHKEYSFNINNANSLKYVIERYLMRVQRNASQRQRDTNISELAIILNHNNMKNRLRMLSHYLYGLTSLTVAY